MSLTVTTLAELLHARAAETPGATAIRTRQGGAWVDRTWKELTDRAERIAAGLLSRVDLADHDVVGLLGQTSEHWLACDFACLSVNLQTVPIYASLHADEVGYCHVDTGIKVAFVDDASQLAKIREMRRGFSFFGRQYSVDDVLLKHVIVIDPTGIEPADDWESLAAVEERGSAKLAELGPEITRRRAAASKDETATYTYTSGTTGPPKAVIQTHENHLSMARSVDAAGIVGDGMKDGGLFLFLPLAHSFGRLIQFTAPYHGMPLVISSVPTLADDVRATRPGFFPAAPRVFEKMKAKIESAVATAPPLRQRLFRMAMGTGRETIEYRCRGQALPALLSLRYALADRVVLSKLRERLGLDRAQALLSGSAPLDPEVHRFFLSMGLELYEAYGLTETCPGLTGNRPGRMKVGTVGPALPGVTLKIAPDGEVLAKGPNVTQGYLNRPDATGPAFDEEGWFCTGDLGAIDDEGFLKITGRKKELIKTSGGKYVAPTKIEGMIKNLPIVQEAVVVGDRRNFCVALVALDPEELAAWATKEGVPAEAGPAAQAAVQAHLKTVNEGLASFETIKYFRLLPGPLTVDNGFLTASLKVKRKVVEEAYAGLLDEMYASGKDA